MNYCIVHLLGELETLWQNMDHPDTAILKNIPPLK